MGRAGCVRRHSGCGAREPPRYTGILGSSLRARTLPAQKTEAKVACSVLNRMARLGMPVSQRVR